MNDPARHQCIISVGSNIEPERNVRRARELLATEAELIGESALIWTAPVGFQEQPDFLNGAFLVVTTLDRAAFKDYLRSVEDRLGRVRGPIKSGPRTIDLDIITWDGEVVHNDYFSHQYVSTPVNELIRNHALSISLDAAG